MKRKVTELVIILLVYLIQGTFGRTIAIGGIVPNLLIILPVLFGFFKGKNEGMFVGFFAGIMYGEIGALSIDEFDDARCSELFQDMFDVEEEEGENDDLALSGS